MRARTDAMRPNTSPQRPLAQLADLLLVQLSNWRWAWRPMVIVGMIAPVTSMLALATFTDDPALRTHIMVGTLMLGLLFQNQNQVAGNFSFMKENGMLDFFAAQPVNRALLALATVGAFFLLSLPALVATVAVGAIALGIGLSPSPLLIVVVPLCVVPAAGIGALIGSLARSPAESTSIGLMVTFLMTGCGPVLIPTDRRAPGL